MRSFLKFLLVLCIVAIIVLLGYAGKYVKNDNKTDNTNTNNENISISNKNETNNEKKEDEIVEEDKQKEENENEEKDEEIIKEDEPVNEENSISNEDKAKDLAKKEYGSSDGVYFRIEQIQSNGVYIVSVRDSETTKDLVWYTVDVINGTVKY